MELEIYYRGRAVGRLQIRHQGLYEELTAECGCFASGIQRVYALSGSDITPLGVLSPRNGGLGFYRRLSRRSLEGKLERAVAGTSWQGFFPWRGRVEDKELENAWLSPEQLAQPFVPGREIPLIHWAAQMHVANIQGEQCLLLPRSVLKL